MTTEDDVPWWRQPGSGIEEENWPFFEDFRKFLWLVWLHLGLPPPTTRQYQIARYLQVGPKRAILQAFRGVGKSWITSALVCWLLMRNPQLKILVVSATKLRADDFTTFTLRLIQELEILAFLRPRDEQRNSKIHFDVGPARPDHSPSVKSVGITGQISGSRADVVIPDDVEVPNNSATVAMRDKLAESIKEFDAVLKPGGRVIYLGTPQTEDSIYGKLQERGYTTRIYPARYPNEKLREVYGPRLAPEIGAELDANPKLEGKTTEPLRFTDLDLAEREASYGRSGFALQFMLDTSLSDENRYPLKLSDLIVMDMNPTMAPENPIWAKEPHLVITELQSVGMHGDRFYRPLLHQGAWVPYTGSVMAIDPSGLGGNELAYAVVKMLNTRLYAPAFGGLLGGYKDENLTKLAEIARDNAVNHVVIEGNFGDGMFTKLLMPFLQRIHPVTVEDVKHSTQKERRIIDTLEPVMNQHRLIVDRAAVEADFQSTAHLPPEQGLRYQMFYQMTRITKDRGSLLMDDRLDALAIAVAYWVEQMDRDIKKLMDKRQGDLLRQEIANVHKAIKSGLAVVFGHLPGGPKSPFGRR